MRSKNGGEKFSPQIIVINLLDIQCEVWMIILGMFEGLTIFRRVVLCSCISLW